MLLVKPMAAFLTAAFCVTDTSKVKCVDQYSCWHYQKAFFFSQKKSLLLRLKFEGEFYSYFLHWCIKSSNSGELLLISVMSENTMSHVIS